MWRINQFDNNWNCLLTVRSNDVSLRLVSNITYIIAYGHYYSHIEVNPNYVNMIHYNTYTQYKHIDRL